MTQRNQDPKFMRAASVSRTERENNRDSKSVGLLTLQPLVNRLTEMDGLAGFVRATVEEVASSLHSIGAVIGLVRDDTLVLEAVFGYQHRGACSFSQVPLDFALPITAAASSKQPIWSRSPQELRRQYSEVRGLDQRTKAFAALPLLIGGKSIGALGLSFASQRQFLTDERRFLLMLADLCAFYLSRTPHTEQSPPLADGPQFSWPTIAAPASSDDLEFRVTLLEDKVSQQARLLGFLGELLTHQSSPE
jgi:GAF domain-containing protein